MTHATMFAVLILGALPALAQDPEKVAGTLREIRDKVAPSVVALEVERRADPEGQGGGGRSSSDKDYFNRPDAPATGTLISADGYILTCAFNVSGDVQKITAVLSDGRRLEATKFGTDGKLDVTLLKIDAKDLPVLPRAKFEDVRVGDFVCIVGRAPEPSVPTVNLGILSALKRREGTGVQTDAEMNYGNVGGPLVNLAGELIGITVAIRPRSSWGQSGGVGFATKMAEIDKAFEGLKKGKVVARAAKGPWIGVLYAEPKEGVEGAIVDQIMPNSPAEEAGLDHGDVITAVDGAAVKSLDALKAELAKKKTGDEVELTVKRQKPDKTSETKKIKVKLVESPD